MESLRRGEALDRALATAHAPHEGALLVRGEPGIGKSHLLQSVKDGAGTTAVLIHVNPAERKFGLSCISGVLAGLRREGVTDFGGRFTLLSEDPDGLFAAAHDLIALIRGFALEPTLLLIDDIDQADEQSRTLIAIMASRLAGTELRLVMTATDTPARSPLAAVPAVSLARLRVAEVVAMGEAQVPDADTSTLRILGWFAGGNPRILEETLRLAEHDQLDGTTWLRLPPRCNQALSDIVGPQLTSVTVPQRLILDSLAIAPLCHSGAIADAGLEIADAVEDLINEGILCRKGPYVTFQDRRLRSYVYWSSDTHTRRERHESMERAHITHSAPLAAWHRSFRTYDRTGIDDLLAGAAELVRSERFDAGIELAERALGKATRIEDHLPAVIELCDRLVRAGDVTLAARYSSRTRPDAVDPAYALRLASFRLLDQMFRSQRIADDEVRALVGLHGHADPLGAARLLTLAATFRGERWEIDEARSLLEGFASLDESADPTIPTMRSTTRTSLDAVEGRQSCPEVSPRLGDVSDEPPSELLTRGHLLARLEHHADARMVLNAVLNHPHSVDRVWIDLARYALITNEIAAGHHRRARAAIEDWAEDSPWLSHRSSTYVYLKAWQLSSLGRLTEAAVRVDECLDLASHEGSPATRARALALRGTMALMSGDPETAVVVLRQVSGFAGRFRNPTMLRHWADYVEACRATGRHREAEGVTQALRRRLDSHRSTWGTLALARCEAIVASDETAPAAFAAALDLSGPADSPYERARTLSAYADRQDALDLPNEARRTRTMMVEAFDLAGTVGWPTHHTASTPDDDEQSMLALLTDEEIAIARQVRDGMRNREIAESLYLSVRTVELRLTHIYRTLGVRSRSHLVAALARIETSSPGEVRERV